MRTFTVKFHGDVTETFVADYADVVTFEPDNGGTVVVTRAADTSEVVYAASNVRELRDITYQTRLSLGPKEEK